MMRRVFLAAALLVAAPAAAIPPLPPPAPPAPPPRLLIVISVDQLSSDLWDEYRPQFTAGLAKLASGTVFRNGYQSHAATETCPGHSTILTGMRPARTGIIGNVWIDQSLSRSDKSVYCGEDERVPGSSSSAYTASPLHLRVPTLGELLKRRSAASLNVAVAGKDRSAIMMAGHLADQRWYATGTGFATDLKSAVVPRTIAAVNGVVQRTVAMPREPLDPPPFCAAKSQVIAIEGGGKPVGSGRFARAAGDAAAFRASPEFDAAVLALSAALVQELRLGADTAPDVLSIGLAGTDYVGHTYGTGGQEMCLQLHSLDRDLGDFFARLDGWGIDYAVALTSDHGGLDIPERLRLRGIAGAARVDRALAASAIGKTIAAKLNLSGPVMLGDFSGDVYLDRSLRPAERARALTEALAIYRGHPQVEGAYSREQIMRTPMPASTPDRWSVIERVRASFDPERSGDIVVVLKPNITPVADTSRYIATHGSPWDYDRRVPIIFWRPQAPAVNRAEPVETVDIMPTLAAMLAIADAAGGVDGKCLSQIHGIACLPR